LDVLLDAFVGGDQGFERLNSRSTGDQQDERPLYPVRKSTNCAMRAWAVLTSSKRDQGVSLSADERGRSRNRLRVVTENRSDGLDSRSFSRIEFLRLAYQHLPVSGRMILMASKLALSESLAWWTRAAQALRIASLLPPRDAKLAEAYAVECEHQARAISAEGIRPRDSSVRSQRAVDPTFKSVRRPSPEQAA
jgi:hypothetical protein